MKRRRILLLCLLLAVAAGIVLCWPRGPKEPVYQGKKLSHWVNEAWKLQGSESQAKASNAICAIGTNALPWLMSEFGRPYSKSRSAFNRWVSRNTQWEFRFYGDQLRTRRAAHGIRLLGSNAAPALPALYTYLADPERCGDAASAMAPAKDLSLPYVRQALASTNTLLARAGVLGMMHLARETETAIPELMELLHHKDPRMRGLVIFGLSWAKSRPDLTIPAIIGAAAHPDPQMRISATNILRYVDSDAAPAIPALLRLMTNSDPRIAGTASNALFRIDPTALPPRGPESGR